MFREFAKDVVEDDGFVDYLWAHEEGSEPAPKSSYHARFDDWGWIVGTGVYIDDIDAAFVASLSRSLLALLVIGVPVSLMMLLVIRGITRAAWAAIPVMPWRWRAPSPMAISPGPCGCAMAIKAACCSISSACARP
nr:cache domain-containing protein [Halomonas elongata]